MVGSLAKVISPLTPVVLHPAPPSSKDGDWSKVVIYGSDPSEEGALIALYDLKYDIVVAKQSLKMYANPPIMDVLGGNVLIPVGLHVLVGLRFVNMCKHSCWLISVLTFSTYAN